MNKILIFIMLLSSVTYSQVAETLEEDMIQMIDYINKNDANGYYSFFVDNNDLKLLYSNSKESDYNKVKFRYAQHLDASVNELFKEARKKISSNARLSILAGWYDFNAVKSDKKYTRINLLLKDDFGNYYNTPVGFKLLDNKLFYIFQKEIDPIKDDRRIQEALDAWTNIKSFEKENQNFQVIWFDKNFAKSLGHDDKYAKPLNLSDEKDESILIKELMNDYVNSYKQNDFKSFRKLFMSSSDELYIQKTYPKNYLEIKKLFSERINPTPSLFFDLKQTELGKQVIWPEIQLIINNITKSEIKEYLGIKFTDKLKIPFSDSKKKYHISDLQLIKINGYYKIIYFENEIRISNN